MVTQRTWTDIVEYVGEFDKREGAVPNRTLYRLLADEGMSIIAERAPIYVKEWTNASAGELTLSSGSCALPIDLLKLQYVEYDGNQLERSNVQRLDSDSSEWRTSTGDPTMFTVEGNAITLDSIPSSATGKLKIRGTAVPPQFSEATSAVNPLTYLPFRHQMMVCDYIISKLPITAVTPMAETQAAAEWAIKETQRRMATRAEAGKSWLARLDELAVTGNRRQYRDFSY